MHAKAALIALFTTFLAAPVAVQGAGDKAQVPAEPAVQAEWQNTAEVERIFVQETNGFSRFDARPAMKIGLMIDADGTVAECLPLAVEEGGPAYGKELCPSILDHARFTPAKDADGNAIRSVYFAYFKEYRPGSAADNRIFG